ncbi:8940_t:CDS:2, partial [Gigaspora rosea]
REPSKITVPILWSESNFDNPNINFGTEMSKTPNYSTKSAKTKLKLLEINGNGRGLRPELRRLLLDALYKKNALGFLRLLNLFIGGLKEEKELANVLSKTITLLSLSFKSLVWEESKKN